MSRASDFTSPYPNFQEMMENFDRTVVTSKHPLSKSISELVIGSHHFTITGYSMIKGLGPGKYKSSDIFNVGGYNWILYFYPDGLNPEDSSAYVSVFIVLASKVDGVRAYFEATLMDQSGKRNHKVFGRHDFDYKFEQILPMRGFDRFYKVDELESSDYLKNDILEIKCTLKVFRNRLEIPRSDYIEIPPSNMGNDFKYLLDSGFGADITFSAGDEKLKAHKLILSARSSFFKSQFVENPDLNEVEILDIEPAVFKLMLEYIYSSDLPNRREFTKFTNTMHHLMVAAVRYDLDRLRLFCEAKLFEEISINNVATSLCLAEQHGCLQLKALCIKFAVTHLEGVIQSKDFPYLQENCPSLVAEILNKRTSFGPYLGL